MAWLGLDLIPPLSVRQVGSSPVKLLSYWVICLSFCGCENLLAVVIAAQGYVFGWHRSWAPVICDSGFLRAGVYWGLRLVCLQSLGRCPALWGHTSDQKALLKAPTFGNKVQQLGSLSLSANLKSHTCMALQGQC